MTRNGIAQDLHFAQVLRAAEGLTQLRPLMASLATFIVSAIVMALGGSLAMKAGFNGAKFVLGVTAIVNFVVLSVGLSAVGVLLMDRAKTIEPRSVLDAFIYGLISLPKFVGFALILAALALAVGAIGGVVYFVCKVPGVGPVILFAAHRCWWWASPRSSRRSSGSRYRSLRPPSGTGCPSWRRCRCCLPWRGSAWSRSSRPT